MSLVKKIADWVSPDSVRTLKAIEKRGQLSRKGNYLHLGTIDNRKIALDTAQSSVLVLGHPGSGKTAGMTVPSILASDTCSVVVHDLKGELWNQTSGHRASLGPTYRLEWSAMEGDHGIRSNSFNFLDPRLVGSPGSNRDTWLDCVGKTMIPEVEGGLGDSYFINRGRSALTGFLHFLVAKINDRTDEDRYAGISERFVGKEASLPMLVDWLVEAQQNIPESASEKDPMRSVLQAVLDEAVEWKYPRESLPS